MQNNKSKQKQAEKETPTNWQRIEMVIQQSYRGNVIRTANEINGEITNFFEQLREHEDELIRMLELTPCSELEYRKCWGGG